MSDAAESFISNVLPFVLFIAAALLAAMLGARGPRRRLGELVPFMDASTASVTGRFSPRLRARYHGRATSFRFVGRSRYRRAEFHATLECRVGVPFAARRKGFGSAIRAALRPAENLELGVVDIDGRHRFSSPEPERLARWISGSSEARAAIDNLFRERGVDRLVLRDGLLRARIGIVSDELATPESIQAALEALDQLARSAEAS